MHKLSLRTPVVEWSWALELYLFEEDISRIAGNWCVRVHTLGDTLLLSLGSSWKQGGNSKFSVDKLHIIKGWTCHLYNILINSIFPG